MEDVGKRTQGRSWLLKPYRFVADLSDNLFHKKTKAHFLYLEVTHRCNLRCISCYTSAGVEKEDTLTLEERKSVVRQAKTMGVRSVSLSGSGEPLLYPDLFELIDYIRSLDMVVVVFTNGTLLDKQTAEFLLSRQVVIYLKLFSLDPVVFDRMVGRENVYRWVDFSYRHEGVLKTVKIPTGLKCLLETWEDFGRPDLIRLEALITGLNSSTLSEVARFCRELGVGFYLETPVFTGRALEHYDELVLDSEGYRTLYDQLAAIQGREQLEKACNGPCPVEKNLVVWTNGDLGFCSCRPAGVGNVRDGSLKRLYRQARKLKRKEDLSLGEDMKGGRFFRRCRARKLYEARHDLPCDY
jgi:MoaA/NifB/PqqE/SkfB family radical SAM enzyme